MQKSGFFIGNILYLVYKVYIYAFMIYKMLFFGGGVVAGGIHARLVLKGGVGD